MRIHDVEGKPLRAIYLALTDSEAGELIDALNQLSEAPSGWHAHVGDAGCATEVSVYRADDETSAF